MNKEIEQAAFICVKDTIDGAYPSLVLGINAARQGMESKISILVDERSGSIDAFGAKGDFLLD